ncbi:MAG: putative lipid II flippase FtsW [Actinomycetes bacterium]|jgi:cell division protein FtsW
MSVKVGTRRQKYSNYLQRPDAPYYMILGSLTFLSALGIVMVLSASSVVSLQQSGSTYSIFFRQLLFFAFSILALLLVSNWKTKVWDRITRYSFVLSFLALCLPLIPGIKLTVNGNTNWIHFANFTMQPSEFAKLGLILWCAGQLRKFDETVVNRSAMRHMGFVLSGTLPLILLILKGGDLGTTVIVLGVVAIMLFVSGLPLRHFLLLGLFAVAGVVGMVALAPYRLHRFAAVLNPFAPEVYKMAGWQPAHSVMGLASGGLFGVGLGASRQKWGNLSEAHTDFIFAVIGEELGLLGTLVVLALYAALIYGIFRTAMQSKDLFSRYACAGVGAWFMMQVIINVGSVIGVLPVVGVTLPFISYGGSSLIANFLGVGYVLNIARKDPRVKAAIKSRKKA